MIKKISAILLALVLCLSVVVVPASAAVELGDAQIAFSLEWDKDYYQPGDTAYLSVYMDAADDIELYTGSLLIGLNSAVFNTTDNPIADVKANATAADWFTAFYKSPATNLSWLTNATQVGRVTDDSTEEEKAAYDMYLKYTAGKDTAGTHENTASTVNGFYGSDFVADEPILTIALVVSADAANGTAVSAGIMSGSLTTTSGTPQTHWKVYSDPGNAKTTANAAASSFDISQTVVASTIGEAGKEYETSIVSYWKDQIKMENSEYTSFSIRHLAVISAADWEANFGTDEDASVEGTKNITDIGFILATGNGSFDKDAATDWLEAGATDATFTKMPVTYVSTGMSGNEGNYVYSVVITGCTDPDASLSSLGYVVWEDAAGTTHYSYFEKVQTETFRELYDGYVAAH